MATPQTASIEGASRLSHLLEELDRMLNEKYSFDVYKKDSINFGIMVTYRQTWKPENCQVGELVSTIPLAPKEVRRYVRVNRNRLSGLSAREALKNL